MPTFRFREWLAGLIAVDLLLFAIAPLFFRGGRPLRLLAWIFSVLMIGNGIGHIGFYSSPLLIAATVWMLVQLKRTRSDDPVSAAVPSRSPGSAA